MVTTIVSSLAALALAVLAAFGLIQSQQAQVDGSEGPRCGTVVTYEQCL